MRTPADASVQPLPECARHVECCATEIRISRMTGVARRKACVRRARFIVQRDGAAPEYACPEHVGLAMAGEILPRRRRRVAEGAGVE